MQYVNGILTVTKPSKIVAKRKQNVGSITSGEPRVIVILLVAVLTTSFSILPIPRQKFRNHFIQNGPTDCIGAGNSSGEITNDKFYILSSTFDLMKNHLFC